MSELTDPQELILHHWFQRYRKEFLRHGNTEEMMIEGFRNYRKLYPHATAEDFTLGAINAKPAATRFQVECLKEGLRHPDLL